MSAPASRPERRRDPASLVPLRWGGYRTRLVAGLWLIVSGGVAIAGSNTFVLLLLLAGTVAHVAGWCILPSAGWRRVVAVLPSTIAVWVLLPGPRFLVVLVVPYLAWLLVRHRPAIAYPTAVFVLAAAIAVGQLASGYEDMLAGLAVVFAVMVASAWLAAMLSQARRRKSS
jgi:hypothetical protein